MLDAVRADFERIPDVMVTTELGAGVGAWALIIAPEFDDHLRRLSQDVLDRGGRLLGSSPAAIRLAADKFALAEFWHARGVPHPRTAVMEDRRAPSWQMPWVVKPRYGAGSQATYLVRSRTEFENARRACQSEVPGGEFVVQECIPGGAVSVALLMRDTQTVPLVPCWQHLSTDGRFRYLGGSLPVPSPLAERAVAVARAAVADIDGLRGYIGVDLILGPDGSDFAIEINPRLTTSYLGLRQLCEQNLAELILRCARGESLPPLTWKPGTVQFEP